MSDIDELNNPPPDLIKLMVVNLPAILNTLKFRFERDLIYTSVGPILVAVNPFKWIKGIYDESIMMKYFNEEADLSSDPHVFAIANEAFQGLKDGSNQSLVISGESGAGKTETTKQCLNYLAHIAGSSNGVQTKILLASPILEAWGNAKTLRNNNSSRFGKFIEIWFDNNYRIIGSSNTTYLLEKSRVVFQEIDERNYHVFYQLLQGCSSELSNELNLSEMIQNPSSVRYINQSGCITIDDVNDAKDYHEAQDALVQLGFNSTEIKALSTIIAAVLHIGNVDFIPKGSNSDESEYDPKLVHHLDIFIKLVGCDPDLMKQSLLTRKIQSGGKRGSINFSPYSIPQAVENKNSMAKEIYNRAFEWIVNKINSVINTSNVESIGLVGILDIFGFEIFKKNSFEQLCINLANEALQQHFNTNIFRVEMELYKSEDIPIPDLNYKDNQDVLDLIMKKPIGLIPVLDEEGVVPKGSWEGFLTKIIKHHQTSIRFKNKHITKEFTVVHYAGEVTYDPKLFLIKNKDTLTQEIVEILSLSSVPIISELFTEIVVPISESSSASSTVITNSPPKRGSTTNTANKLTVGKKFSIQLEALIQNLNSTKPHYIRCIKPNDKKKPDIFMSDLTNEQLTYSGVFEAVIILQSGYPFRLSLFDFRSKYHMLILKTDDRNLIFQPNNPSLLRKQCGHLVDLAIKYGHKTLYNETFLGKSKVFYRAPVHYYLIRTRNQIIHNGYITLQRYARGYIIRKLYHLLLNNNILAEVAILARNMPDMDKYSNILLDICNRFNLISHSDKTIASDEGIVARSLYTAMLVEVEVVQVLHELLKDKTLIFDKFPLIIRAFDKAKESISFEGFLKGAPLSHTWQQNPFLVETNNNINRWKDIVDIKQKMKDSIKKNDEINLEDYLLQLDDYDKQGLLDGVIDVSVELSQSKAIIFTASNLCNDFINESKDVLKIGRFVINNSNTQTITFNVSVDDHPLDNFVQLYLMDPNSLMKQQLISKRITLCVEVFQVLVYFRYLAKLQDWTHIWKYIYIWENLLDITISSIPPNSQQLSNSDSKQIDALNKLSKVLTFSKKQIVSLPTSICHLLREELIDITRACINEIIIPKLYLAVNYNYIPKQLYLDPEDSKINITDLKNELDITTSFTKFFNSTILSSFMKAKEHLRIRSSYLSNDFNELDETIKSLEYVTNIEVDYINGKAFSLFLHLYADLQYSIYDKCPKGLPGFISYNNIDISTLETCTNAISELNVIDKFKIWNQLVYLCQILLSVRNNCYRNTYDNAIYEINQAKGNSLYDISLISSTTVIDLPMNDIRRLVFKINRELEDSLIECKHRIAVSKLSNQVKIGCVKGKIGKLDIKSIEYKILKESLGQYKQDVIKSTSDYQLVIDTTYLIELRSDISNELWDKAGILIQQVYQSSDQLRLLHDVTKDEFVLIYHGYLDRQAFLNMKYSIEHNALQLTEENDINRMIMNDDDIYNSMNDSIKQSLQLELISDDTKLLLLSCQVLYALRLAINSNYWDKINYQLDQSTNLNLLNIQELIVNNAEKVDNQDAVRIIESLISSFSEISIKSLNELPDCTNLSIEEILINIYNIVDIMHVLVISEIKLIYVAYIERSCRISILLSTSIGKIIQDKETISSYNNIYYKPLVLALYYSRIHCNILSNRLNNWLKICELILYIRIVTSSSSSVHLSNTESPIKVTDIKIDVIVDNIDNIYIDILEYIDIDELSNISSNFNDSILSINEITHFVDLLVDRRLFKRLEETFYIGRPIIYMGNFDIQYVKFDHMEYELELTKKCTNRSDRLDRLLFYADLCVKIRSALLENHWDNITSSNTIVSNLYLATKKKISIKECIHEFNQANKFFRDKLEGLPPQVLIDDISLIHKEYNKRLLLQTFPSSLQTNRISGMPLKLQFRNIKNELIYTQINRVKEVDNDNELGSDITRLINAAEEIISIRSEAMIIQSYYTRDSSLDFTSNSVNDILKSNYLSSSIITAVDMVSNVTSRKDYLSKEWEKIENLMSHLTYANTIPTTKYEISLLAVETFIRGFISKMLGIFNKIDLLYKNNEFLTIDITILNDYISILHDSCQTYLLTINIYTSQLSKMSNKFILPNVLEMIFNSSIILIHILRSDLLGLFDSLDRNWKNSDSLGINTPRINIYIQTVKDGKYSLQTILRSIDRYNIPLHFFIKRLVTNRQLYLEDMISYNEIEYCLSKTESYIYNRRSIEEDIVPTDLNIESMVVIKQRIDSIGLVTHSNQIFYQSFLLIYYLRCYISTNQYIQAFDFIYYVVTSVSNGLKEESIVKTIDYINSEESQIDINKLDSLLSIILDNAYTYPIHKQIKEEFIYLLQVSVDRYFYLLCMNGLLQGHIVGSRSFILIDEISYKMLDRINDISKYSYTFSNKAIGCIHLCKLVYTLRKLVKENDISINHSISEMIEKVNITIELNCNINEPLNHTYIYEIPSHLSKYIASHVSQYKVTSHVKESIINECKLFESHINFMTLVNNMLDVSLLPLLTYSTNGLIVNVSINQLWIECLSQIDDLQLTSNYAQEKWYLYIYEIMNQFIVISRSILQWTTNDIKTIDVSNNVLNYSESKLDGNVDNTIVREIISNHPNIIQDLDLSVDISNCNLIPGTQSFSNLINDIENLLDQISTFSIYCEELTTNNLPTTLPDMILSMSYFLSNALLEHKRILNLREIINNYRVEDYISNDSGHYIIKVVSTTLDNKVIRLENEIEQHKDRTIDDITTDVPWLETSKHNNVSVSQSDDFTLDIYNHYIDYLTTLTFDTCIGRLFNVFVRLYIELYFSISIQSWTKAQSVTYLLSNITILSNDYTNHKQNCLTVRKYIDILTMKRFFEQGIIHCVLPIRTGWSLSIASAKESLTINDNLLGENVQYYFMNNYQIVLDSSLLYNLIALSMDYLSLITLIRLGKWENNLSNDFYLSLSEYLNIYSTINSNSLFISNTLQYTSITDCIDGINSKLSQDIIMHPTIKKFILKQLFELKCEIKLREISADISNYLNELKFSGSSGFLDISNQSIIILVKIIDLLDSNDELVHHLVSTNNTIKSIYQSSRLIVYISILLSNTLAYPIDKKYSSYLPEFISNQLSNQINPYHSIYPSGHLSKYFQIDNDMNFSSYLSVVLPNMIPLDLLDHVRNYIELGKEMIDVVKSDNINDDQYSIVISDHLPVYSIEKLREFSLDQLDSNYNQVLDLLSNNTTNTNIKSNIYLQSISPSHTVNCSMYPLYDKFYDCFDLLYKHYFYLKLANDYIDVIHSNRYIFQDPDITTNSNCIPGEIIYDDLILEALDCINSHIEFYLPIYSTDITPVYLLSLATSLISKLRQAIKFNLFDKLEKLFNELESSNKLQLPNYQFISLAKYEISLYYTDYIQKDLSIKLFDSLNSVGIPVQFTDIVDTSLIDVIKLEKAIEYCKLHQPLSNYSNQQLMNVQLIYHIRQLYKNRKWNEIIAYIDKCIDYTVIFNFLIVEITNAKLFSYIYSTIESLHDLLVDNNYILSTFASGWNNEVVISEPDLLHHIKYIDINKLALISDMLSKIPSDIMTKALFQYIDNVDSLLHIRRLIMSHQWTQCHDIIMITISDERMTNYPIYDMIYNEMVLYREISSYMISSSTLRNAINTGKCIGEVGRLVTTYVSISHLQAAIDVTNQYSSKHRTILTLINTCKILLELRKALIVNYWMGNNNTNTPGNEINDIDIAINYYGSIAVEEVIYIAESSTGSIKSPISSYKSISRSNKSNSGIDYPYWIDSLTIMPEELNIIDMSTISSIHSIVNKINIKTICPWNELSQDKINQLFQLKHEQVMIDISNEANEEITLISEQLIYHKIVIYLLVGLSSKGPENQPGVLDVTTINISNLKKAITLANYVPEISNVKRCSYLLRDCKYLLSMRLKRLQLDYIKLSEIISTIKAYNQLDTCLLCKIDSSKGDSKKDGKSYYPIFKSVYNEMLIYESDMIFQKLVNEYIEDINNNKINQPVNQIDLNIQPIVELTNLMQKTNQASLIYLSNEYNRLLDAMNILVELRVRRLYQPNTSYHDLLNKVNEIKDNDIRSNNICYVDYIIADLTYISNLSNKQTQLDLLESEIIKGQQYVKYPIGHINMNDIDISELQEVITSCSSLLTTLGNKNDLSLLSLANTALQLRKLLVIGIWSDIEQYIVDHIESCKGTLLEDEMNRLIVEIDNYYICRSFETVLMKDRLLDVISIAKLIDKPIIKYQLDSLITISLDDLINNRMDDLIDSSIDHESDYQILEINKNRLTSYEITLLELKLIIFEASQLKTQSDECLMYYKSAILIYRIRCLVLLNEWTYIHQIIRQSNLSNIPHMVSQEIHAIQSGIIYKDMIISISEGILNGFISGSVGSINILLIDYNKLQLALLKSNDMTNNLTTHGLDIIINIGNVICNLRRYIKENYWMVQQTNTSNNEENQIVKIENIIYDYKNNIRSYINQLIALYGDINHSDIDGKRDDVSDLKDIINSFIDNLMNKQIKRLIINEPINKSNNMTIRPFQSVDSLNPINNEVDTELNNDIDRQNSLSSDWMIIQWKAILSSIHEIQLVEYEIENYKIKYQLIDGLEHIPNAILHYQMTEQANRMSINVETNDQLLDNKIDSAIDSKIDNLNDPMYINYLSNIINQVKGYISLHSNNTSADVLILLTTCELILKYRTSITKGIDILLYKQLIDQTNHYLSTNQISLTYGTIELRIYQSTYVTIDIVRLELIKSMSNGRIIGYLDQIDLSLIDISNLSYNITYSRVLIDTFKQLAIGLQDLVIEAELLLSIRKIVLSNQIGQLGVILSGFFNNSNQLIKVYQFITEELIHVNMIYTLYNTSNKLKDLLYHHIDISYNNTSIVILQSIQLSIILNDFKHLLMYKSNEFIPAQTSSYDLPISPNNAIKQLYDCGNLLLELYSCICHKQWGSEVLASGDVSHLTIPRDNYLSYVMSRFRQLEASNRLTDVHSQLMTKIQSSRPNNTKDMELNAKIESAKMFVYRFEQIGTTYSESSGIAYKNKTRRISITSSSQDLSQATNSNNIKKGRRVSIGMATQESRRQSNNQMRSNSILLSARRPSVYNTIDTPMTTVLDILCQTNWTPFLDPIRQQFDLIRDILIDHSIQLRLMSCCMMGRITVDTFNNIIIPEISNSLELLYLVLKDINNIKDEANQRSITIEWTKETNKWIYSCQILLACRSALVDDRINDLIIELKSIGYMKEFSLNNIINNQLVNEITDEIVIIEQFAIEYLVEQSVTDFIQQFIKLSIKLQGNDELRYDVTMLRNHYIKELIDLKENMIKRMNSSIYYKQLKVIIDKLFIMIQSSIVGNQYKIDREYHSIIALINTPPNPLIDALDNIHQLYKYMIISACNISGSIHMNEFSNRISIDLPVSKIFIDKTIDKSIDDDTENDSIQQSIPFNEKTKRESLGNKNTLSTLFGTLNNN